MSLNNQDFLLLTDALIKRWAELVREELAKDIAKHDESDVFQSWVLRAYWDRFVSVLLNLNKSVPKPSNPQEELQLVERVYGDILELPSTRTPQDVENRLEWFKRRAAKKFEHEFRTTIDRYGVTSPIEQIFLMEWKFSNAETELSVKLSPQEPVATDEGSYRLDFQVKPATEGRATFVIGIELDGHEFHERTKEQVARDKKRERAIVRAGVTVLRFSGSEVFHNTRKCIAEVTDFIRKQAPADG
jgi:very-short-patch-repair endonuclease